MNTNNGECDNTNEFIKDTTLNDNAFDESFLNIID